MLHVGSFVRIKKYIPHTIRCTRKSVHTTWYWASQECVISRDSGTFVVSKTKCTRFMWRWLLAIAWSKLHLGYRW